LILNIIGNYGARNPPYQKLLLGRRSVHETWDSLEQAQHYRFDVIRHCPDCNEKVHLVADEADLLQAIESNYCVAIPFDITNLKKTTGYTIVGVHQNK
jgi:hypothetical protein